MLRKTKIENCLEAYVAICIIDLQIVQLQSRSHEIARVYKYRIISIRIINIITIRIKNTEVITVYANRIDNATSSMFFVIFVRRFT